MADTNVQLDDLLGVGRAVVVDAEPTLSNGTRFSGVIRGWQRGDYILFDMGEGYGEALRLEPYQVVVIRFLSEGKVCAFSTTVADHGSGKYESYFRAKWPRELRVVMLRQEDRVNIHVPCTIEMDPDKKLTGHVTDISGGGCRILLADELNKDDVLQLSFLLPDGSALEQLGAVVRSVNPMSGGYAVGCAFESMNEVQRTDIRFFIAVSLERRPHRRNERPWVLVVDPDPEAIVGLEKELKQKGIELMAARNSIHGVTLLGSVRRPAAVLMNWGQQKCTAAELCRVIMSEENMTHVPVMVYDRGEGDEETKEKAARGAGASEYFASLKGDQARLIKAVDEAAALWRQENEQLPPE